MILHLFYKEWIKTRWAFLGALIIGICIVFYIFIMVENRMTMLGAKNYTLSVLYDNPPVIYYSLLQYIPLLTAICIGISQYIPEVKNKRIRLTLHLPMNNQKLIACMALFGLVLITVSNGSIFVLFEWKNQLLFPAEVTRPVTVTIINWFIASYLAYNYIAMTALEPNGYRQLLYAITGLILLSLYFNNINFHGAYKDSAPVLAIIALVSCPLVLFSGYRLNKGER